MEHPRVTFEERDGYLLVVGHGARNSLAEMTEAASEIYRKVEETKQRFLLVDYRKLKINVHMGEAFNIVKRYEVSQPGLKNAVIAAVFGEQGADFGIYWKEVGKRRGFTIESFDSMEAAELWLKTQMS